MDKGNGRRHDIHLDSDGMITVRVTDSSGNSVTKTIDLVVNQPPTNPNFYRVGISSSRQGLSGGETHKRAETNERYAEMAAQVGVTATALKRAGGRHVYDQSNNPVSNVMSVGVFANCVADGFGTVMFTSSQWQDMAGVAAGNHDATIKACLNSMSAQNVKVIWNVKHEPSNNGWGAAEEALWRKIQARMAWLVAAHNDPDILYSDCHIPMAADEAKWNWMPELKALRPNDWEDINARTYLGLDPYPEIGSGGTLQTIQSKCGKAITAQRGWGRTGPICLPEVAFFNWVIATSSTGPLTAAQQAQRLHDQLWTWGQANNLQAYFYFDVASLTDSDVRDSSRTLDTAPELKEYANLILGTYF